jgi:cysteine sulfinate desulfinase/cysteine desulfurase-like protein
MAWALRRGRKFFYRSRRVGTEVVKEYVGCGLAAQIAARRDAETRDRREKAKDEVSQMVATMRHADDLLGELNGGVELLVAAEMLTAGFHSHGTAWRRSRE